MLDALRSYGSSSSLFLWRFSFYRDCCRSAPWRRLGLSRGWFLCYKGKRGRKHVDLLCTVSPFGRWVGCSNSSLAFVGSTCHFGEFVFLPDHTYTEQKGSKAVLKAMEVRKKNTLFCSIGNVFPKVLKTGWLRGPSLSCLVLTLLGQNGVSHCHINVNPLGWGHPLEKVQSFFFIPPWLEPIIPELHMYIPVSLEPLKTFGYLVMQDKKNLFFQRFREKGIQ